MFEEQKCYKKNEMLGKKLNVGVIEMFKKRKCWRNRNI